MTVESSQVARWRKFAFSVLLGALTAYLALEWGLVPLIKALKIKDGGAIAVAGVGLIYVLMGLGVGLGTVFPKAGVQVLNVTDEDLSEQRAILGGSALCSLLFGIALILLAFAEPVGPVSAGLALSALGGSILLICLVSWLQWDKYDELLRQISLEGSGIGFLIVLPVLIGWAAAAQLGMVVGFSPLGVVALLSIAMLLGSFIAAGRRGMLIQ